MLLHNTPLEDYRAEYGLMVKREDMSCPPPGPPFSKTRGVFAHVKNRPEQVIGVLDTYHSQAGQAVAFACSLLGKECINFYPEYVGEPGPRGPQIKAQALGAKLVGIPAGRSFILYHQAKKQLPEGAYMMPNALKLPEMVEETAAEVKLTLESNPNLGIKDDSPILIAISSGTIAAGVIKGMIENGQDHRQFLLHMGYQRPWEATLKYISGLVGIHPKNLNARIIDEKYTYKQQARPGRTPPWPCNGYYDLKAFRWWMNEGRYRHDDALLWNIG
jgi:hypothetical protein